MGFLEQPSQYEINKADDYKRCLLRIGRKNSGNTTASSGNTPGNTTTSSGKRKVAQLGMQANKSIAPLKVLSNIDHQNIIAMEFA